MSEDRIPATGAPQAAPWPALIVMVAAAFMDLLDSTIVQVALPAMQEDLRLTDADLQWVSTAYVLAFTIALITCARLGDILGRKRAFLIGLTIFVVASLAAALAVGPGMLIAFRAVQGAAAALMLPQVLTFIQVEFDEKAKPKAFASYGMLLAVASASGPLLGGLLIQGDIAGMGWRTIFLVNVPIGLAALAVGMGLIPESRPATRPRLDPIGLALIAVALLAVFYPLIQGRYLGWPAWSFAVLACAIPLLAAFVIVEVRTRHRSAALIDLTLFTRRETGVALLIALLFFGTTSYFFVLTLHLQDGLGYDPLRAGVTFLPFSLGTILGSIAATPLGSKLGRGAIAIAAAIMLASLGAMILVIGAQGAELNGWALAAPQTGAGLAFGIASGTLATLVLARVPAQRAAAASGVVNTVVELGSVSAIAIIGAIFFTTLGDHPATTQFVDATTDGIWYLVAASTASLLLTALLPARHRPAGARR